MMLTPITPTPELGEVVRILAFAPPSVTGGRPASYEPGEFRNGPHQTRSEGVTDERPEPYESGQRTVTCSRCGAAVGSDENVLVRGPSYRQRRWTQEFLCIDCVNNRGRYEDVPWSTWCARQMGRTWRDYQNWCAHCGRPFLGVATRRWCSEACGEAARAARRDRTRPPIPARRCEMCGELIDATRGDAKFCSSACRQKAYRQRKAAT